MSIRAGLLTGNVVYSGSTLFSTFITAPKGNISFDNVEEDIRSVFLTISHSFTDFIGFEYKINEKGEWVDNGSQTDFNVENLQPFNRYTIYVRAYNEDSFSEEYSIKIRTAKTIKKSDRFRTRTTAFSNLNKNSVDFSKSFGLFGKIVERYGFNTVYTTNMPFIYVEGKFRRFKYFEKEVSSTKKIFDWTEEEMDEAIMDFIGVNRHNFYNVDATPSENVILSIKEIDVNENSGRRFISGLIDMYFIDK